jgi:outer membrane protein OmpA-like peptidoglycan-associated protein/WD40 repeat protein
MTRISRFSLAVVAMTALTQTAMAAPKWDFADHGTQDPARLFQIAYDSDSAAEKLRIRSWLAAHHPATQQGLFSRAWMAEHGGDGTTARNLYQDCVKRYPTFVPCLVNGTNVEVNAGAPGPAGDALAALEPAALQVATDATPIRNAYFYLSGTRKDPAAANAVLARARASFPNAWTLDFVEGLVLHTKDPARALALYRSAIAKGGKSVDPEVFERLIKLETGALHNPDAGSRIDIALRRTVEYYRQTGEFRNNLLAQFLVDEYARNAPQRVQIIKALEGGGLIPSRELLDEIQAVVATQEPQWYARLRAQQASRAQRDPTLNEWLGYVALAAESNPAEAVRLYRIAIDAAYSDRQRTKFATFLLWNLRLAGECRLADSEARALVSAQPSLAKSADFYSNWFESQLCVGDFAGARASLTQRAALGSTADSLLSDEARLSLLTAEQAQQGSTRDAFISGWQAQTGGRLTLQIEFATGSAQIPAGAEPTLRQLADALKQPQAADYVFEIAGHSDSTGNAEQNQKLSQRRAQALVDHLVQRHGLSTIRLRATGYGPAFPVADNQSEQGRQRNRRVEITPVSSAASPAIAKVGRPSGSPTLSNDGRLLLDAKGVLWDTRQWIAVRQLPDARRAIFSRDGRYVIGLSRPSVETMDASFWVYELATNRILARRLLGANAKVERFAISPDGKRLATVRDGLLEIMDLPTLTRQKVLMLSRQLGSGVVAWVGNGRVAAAVRNSGENLQLVDVGTMRIEKTFEGVDYVHALGTSNSGRYLVATPNSGELLVWDTASWQRRQLPAQNWSRYSSEYRFHPLREQMVADQWNGSSGQTTVLVNLETLQVSRAIAEGAEAHASFTPDGESLYVAGSPMQRLSLPSLAPVQLGFAELPAFSFWTLHASEGLVTNYIGNQWQIWDVAAAKPLHRLQSTGKPVYGQANQRWASDESGTVNLIDAKTFDVTPQGSVPAAYKDWVPHLTGTRWIFSRRLDLPVGKKERSNKEGELAVVDRASGRELARHRFSFATEDFIYSSDEYPLNSNYQVEISPDGRYAALATNWREHWGYDTRHSKIVQIFDLQTGKRVKRLEMNKGVVGIAFPPEQPGVLLVRNDKSVSRYRVESDSFGNSYAASKAEQILFDDGARRYQRNPFYVTEISADGRTRVLPSSGAVDGLVLPDRNLLLLEIGHELRYYDLKTLTHQLSLLSKRNGEWVAYTPDGQYSASANGTAGLYWSLGEATLPFAALKEKFERPNVVRDRLQGVLQGEAAPVQPVQVVETSRPAASTQPATQPSVGAGPATQLDASFFDPPFKLRILEYPSAVDGSSLTLKVGITKTRATDLEPAIELNVNGQQVEARGLARLDAASEGSKCAEGGALKVGCETVRNVPLTLEEGRNVIAVNVFFKGGRAQPEVIRIERKKSIASGPMPRLWFFGVGVSQYKDSAYDLKYAHRDAEALAATFAKQEGKLYSKVNTRLLLNKEADARTVKAEMNRFLRQASSQDLIVIFLAGHGMQDNDQTLYFMSSDANMDEPFTGIGVNELQDFLRRRPMSQKALLLLDICHAGSAAGKLSRRGAASGDDVINQLASGTGVKVLASSQGREYSLEQAEFRGGHGAFTAALLEGLEGRAGSGNGKSVSVLELERFVSQRVPEITRGKQHPTSPDSSNFQDYPITVP